MAALAAHRLALLSDEHDGGSTALSQRENPRPEPSRGAADDNHDAALDDEDEGEEEYVPVKRRRLLEAQGRYQRLGRAGAPTADDAGAGRDAGAQAREQQQARDWPGAVVESASRLTRWPDAGEGQSARQSRGAEERAPRRGRSRQARQRGT